jgi:hypothetical protein
VTDIRVSAIELGELAEDLRLASEEVIAKMRPVVSRGAANIKDDWRTAWKTLGPHITDLPWKVNYDLDDDGSTIDAQIGPDLEKGGQAPLANIIEFADGNVRSAPHPAGAHALAAEEPRFEQAVADVAEQLLDGRR